MSRENGVKGAPIIIIGEIGMDRSNERLWKLIGNDKLKPPIPAKSQKSVKAELEFYQSKFRGGKPKSVRDRIDRLTDALDILVEDDEKIEC